MKKITKSVVYLLAGIFANGCNNCEPFIVAHRGNSSVAPENTIAAYLGVTGIDARVGIVLDRDYIQKVKSAGLDFHVWTIDTPDNTVRLKNAGVTSITTNRPIKIRKALFNQ
jgi:glycerophosphoryl diester phosphodiesterase